MSIADLAKNLTTAFSCGARSAFKLKERGYLRNMLSAVSCKALLARVEKDQLERDVLESNHSTT